MPTDSSDGTLESGEGSESRRTTLEDVLVVFENRTDRARPLTANDIMEELDCSRRTAHNRLEELVERDLLRTRKTGARSRVWWIPIEEPPETVEGDNELPDSVRNAVEEMDMPGQGTLLEARREAVLGAFAYLRENPEARKSDFQRDVYPDHPAGYESPESWWNAVQPALKKVPGIDPPEEREHIWHFLGG